MSGPYQTQRQAADSVRHITNSPPGAGAWQDGSHRLLEDACRAAGVKLGAYDEQVLVWLAGWEPWVCAVIAGLITRAHAGALDQDEAATVTAALEDAAEYREYQASLACADCAASPAELCDDHAAKLDTAGVYRELARRLDGAR